MKYGNNPNEQIYNWLFLKYYNFVIQDFCVTKNNTTASLGILRMAFSQTFSQES